MSRPSVAPSFWKRKPLIQLALNAPEADYPPGSFSADPEITETQVSLPRLPAVDDGLRIVHLTDIHLGLFTSVEEVQRVVDLANLLDPDVVALTGDYVTFSPTYIWPVAQALSRLRARLGVFAVLGNHDFRVGAEEVTRALRAYHIRVLRNASYALCPGDPVVKKHKVGGSYRTGATLWIAGVDDPWVGVADLGKALQPIPPRDPKILLCHNPETIGEAARRGVDLMLSGHTH
ncbi:MAG: metallophosphoesterase, partial [Terriglobia bacterium]